MLQVSDLLGLREADYDKLVDAARTACMQQTASQQACKTTQRMQLEKANAELQLTLKALTTLVSRGMLSTAGCESTVQEIISKVNSNKGQILGIEQELATLHNSAALDAHIDKLVTDRILEGCSRSKKRRRPESTTA